MTRLLENYLRNYTWQEIAVIRKNLRTIYKSLYDNHMQYRADFSAYQANPDGKPPQSCNYHSCNIGGISPRPIPEKPGSNQTLASPDSMAASLTMHFYRALIESILKHKTRTDVFLDGQVKVTPWTLAAGKKHERHALSLSAPLDANIPTPDELIAFFDSPNKPHLSLKDAAEEERYGNWYSTYKITALYPLSNVTKSFRSWCAKAVYDDLGEKPGGHMSIGSQFSNDKIITNIIYPKKMGPSDIVRDTLLKVLPPTACNFSDMKIGEPFNGRPDSKTAQRPSRLVTFTAAPDQFAELTAQFKQLAKRVNSKDQGRAA